ncbi:MAG: hypothetical protein ABI658_10865 [Acidimicrobiales bacterium]
MTGDGSPNAGWWRSGNGEWYPPELLPEGWSVGPDGVPRSFQWPGVMPPANRVTERSLWQRLAESYRSWPGWVKVAAPVAALVLTGSAAAAFMLGDGAADLHAVASTRTSTRSTTSGTSPAPVAPAVAPAPVSVNGLVITVPPTIAATAGSTSTVAPAVSATTTRGNLRAAPTSTTTPTIPTTTPTSSVTTTGSTTTAPTTTRAATTGSTTTRVITTTRVTTTAPTTTRAPATHTVTGTVLVDSRMNVSDACGGSGRFAQFQNGQSIVLTDAAGRVVGQGALTGCRWLDWRFSSGSFTAKPEFSLTISGVGESSSYTPTVAWKTWPAVALNAIRSRGWVLDLQVR